ncbi:lysophospholipid acyltransferase family protein [Auraticoccus monumenti]|uniref:1-acyl-sn-glycerol-3-phosphate acyltransferases n=1 Tax=Auraticoccus monumenti TaxID=675864 RepID=A0A1G7CNT6_9ACTN|nr:lysophospholipid acyltransferase family protein [Auraticoccus monumenti]SDE40979.1 1-acyl-sn-glycerol-3-phosphate acyltransferases [Auraticoccus monumenti]
MDTLDASAALARRPLASVMRDPPEPFIHRCVAVLGWLMRHLTRPDWRHLERVPATGGGVVVVNHISNADFLSYGHFIAWSGRWPRFMAKAELFDAPVVGRIARSAGQIRVDRGTDRAREAVLAAQRAVQEGRLVSIYPEGTITADPDGWPMRLRSGAARIALATGCPVVPVGQWGVQELMPGRRLTFPRVWRRPVSRVVAGPPVPLDDLRARPLDEEVVREATERIATAITALVAELRQQVPPAGRWDLELGRRVAPSVPGGVTDPAGPEQHDDQAGPGRHEEETR